MSADLCAAAMQLARTGHYSMTKWQNITPLITAAVIPASVHGLEQTDNFQYLS